MKRADPKSRSAFFLIFGLRKKKKVEEEEYEVPEEEYEEEEVSEMETDSGLEDMTEEKEDYLEERNLN